MNKTYLRNRAKAFVIAFLCIDVIGLCVWLLVGFSEELFPKQTTIAGVALVAAALILPIWMKQAFSPSPALVLDESGIKIDVGPQSPALIQWEYVAGVNVTSSSGIGELRITDSSGPEVLITSAMVKGELSEIANEIEKFRAEHG